MRWVVAMVFAFSAAPSLADETPDPVSEAAIWECITAAGAEPRAATSCIGTFANTCMEAAGAYDTITVTQCMEAETIGWDAALNTAYQDLRADLSGPDVPAGAADALRDAQRAWIPFRDAEFSWRGNLTTGTSHITDGAQCVLDVTATRVLDLVAYGGGQ